MPSDRDGRDALASRGNRRLRKITTSRLKPLPLELNNRLTAHEHLLQLDGAMPQGVLE
jgi:hypothetical protein